MDILGQRLRPRAEAGTSAIDLISGAPADELVSYRCLEAFDIWDQDWVVDARKLLDALQHFSRVSHLGTKGDATEASPRTGREPVYRKSFNHRISVLQNPGE